MVSGSIKRILGNSLIVVLIVLLIIFVLQYYEYDFVLLQYIAYDFALLGFIQDYIVLSLSWLCTWLSNRLDLYTCLGSYSVYPVDPWVNDRYCVGMVLIPYLSAIVPNMPDRGVVRDSDSFIDSYIVPLSCIGLAEQHYYRGVIKMFLIFLANITMHERSLVSQ